MEKENVNVPPRRVGPPARQYFGPSELESKRVNDSQLYITTSRQPMLRIDLATPEGFIEVVKQQHSVKAVLGLVYNIDYVTVIAADRTVVLTLRPEMETEVKPYLEGECARLMKVNSFFEFLNRVAPDTNLSPDIAAAVSAVASGTADPIPVCHDISKFDLTVSVCGAYKNTLNMTVDYDPPLGDRKPVPLLVAVRCINAMAVRKALIKETLEKIPSDIVTYHGRVNVGD